MDADGEREFTAWAVGAWPRLLRTATALTAGDHHLAEDLVQTALAKTYLVWDRVRLDEARGEHPDRYVHRVLVRAFVDETRRPWWRRERVSRSGATSPGPGTGTGAGLADPGPPWPDGADPAGQTAQDDVLSVLSVRGALAALPPDQRAAVVLRHWLGHDVAQTAALLRCPEATVRSRTARGLARLRDLLGENGFDDGGVDDLSGLGDRGVPGEAGAPGAAGRAAKEARR